MLYQAKSYAECAILCTLNGYGDSYGRYLDRKHYDDFIYSMAGGRRIGKGIMNKKATKFRDELLTYQIEVGLRDKDGAIRPSKQEILNCKQTFDWCLKYHKKFLDDYGIEYNYYEDKK